MPTTFVPHGGGPWPVLKLAMMDAAETAALADYMRSISDLPKTRPACLLVVSAHWETTKITVNTGPKPPMLYDYGGFPEEAYALQWPAPGDAKRAARVRAVLADAGLSTDADEERGFDHGVFIPLMLAYPQADIPVVQVSMNRTLDPEEHLRLGRALAPLRDEGFFIIGSGNSFHNLKVFFTRNAAIQDQSEAFDAWLKDTVALDAPARAKRLRQWESAPGARICHPREEHLLPLMVAAGAAGDDRGRIHWQGTTNGYKLSAHAFG